MSRTEVAEGVYRLGTGWVNFYLVVDGPETLLVDAGYPGYRRHVAEALGTLGRSPHSLTAVIVTHHHVDHAGTAEHFRVTAGAAVLVHEVDAPVVRGERRSHVPPGFYHQSWRPSMARYLAHTVAVGGARYRPVPEVRAWSEDQVLDLPGGPRLIHTPGHTPGHSSVLLERRGVLFSGDAMANFDYATGESGLRQHRFNDDRERALASLDHLEGYDADVVLFGHGGPWTGGSRRAIEIVKEGAQ